MSTSTSGAARSMHCSARTAPASRRSSTSSTGSPTPTRARSGSTASRCSSPAPRDAIERGIGMVHQHFMLIPVLTVTENVVLGQRADRVGDRPRLRAAAGSVRAMSRAVRARDRSATRSSRTCRSAIQQRVEIVKIALPRRRHPDFRRTDRRADAPGSQPNSSRSSKACAPRARPILFITHKLNEVIEIADRITVLRHGKVVGEADPGDRHRRASWPI